MTEQREVSAALEAMRVSVTNVESFRLYRTGEWMSFDRLMASLLRLETPTENMEVGTALSEILEQIRGKDQITSGFANGYEFDFSGLDAAMTLHPLREFPCRRVYQLGDVELTVSGRVDGFDGLAVDDYKCKISGSYDAEGYGDSCQWKLYLSILGAQRFNYQTFIGSLRNGVVTVKELHTLPLYRYPELEDDVRFELTEYVEFAREYLTPPAIEAFKKRFNEVGIDDSSITDPGQ